MNDLIQNKILNDWKDKVRLDSVVEYTPGKSGTVIMIEKVGVTITSKELTKNENVKWMDILIGK